MIMRTLINIYFVKTNATPTILCLKIAVAHILIVEHQYNIDTFNMELNRYIHHSTVGSKKMGKQPKTSLHIVQRPTNWCLTKHSKPTSEARLMHTMMELV